MKFNIKGTHLALTPAIKQYTEEKIGALTKFDDDLQIARVELEELTQKGTGQHFRAEVQINAADGIFRAEHQHEDLYAAIDLVVPKLTVQMEKARGKDKKRTRNLERKAKEGKI